MSYADAILNGTWQDRIEMLRCKIELLVGTYIFVPHTPLVLSISFNIILSLNSGSGWGALSAPLCYGYNYI